MNAPDDVLTNTDAAELAGVKPSTWRDYVSDGRAPAPDGRVGVTPWWRRSTVEAWVASRPGQGARTDLRAAFKRDDLAALTAAAATRYSAFDGLDVTGRTVRIVGPFYDPEAEGDPGYWVVLEPREDGEPDVRQFVGADGLAPVAP